jgi:hypothetical protein
MSVVYNMLHEGSSRWSAMRVHDVAGKSQVLFWVLTVKNRHHLTLKSTRLVHDSYPKFVSKRKSNLPRYSSYSSLCVDSVHAEVIFWPNWRFHGKFSLNLVPLKAPERVMDACVGSVNLLHTESMRSEPPLVNRVKAEWDSMLNESTRSGTHVNWWTNIYKDFDSRGLS